MKALSPSPKIEEHKHTHTHDHDHSEYISIPAYNNLLLFRLSESVSSSQESSKRRHRKKKGKKNRSINVQTQTSADIAVQTNFSPRSLDNYPSGTGTPDRKDRRIKVIQPQEEAPPLPPPPRTFSSNVGAELNSQHLLPTGMWIRFIFYLTLIKKPLDLECLMNFGILSRDKCYSLMRHVKH
jgi:hypothetical protein